MNEPIDVNEFIRSYLLSGVTMLKADENSPLSRSVLADIQSIIDVHNDELNRAVREYRKNQGNPGALDNLMISILPIHYKIWYEAYSPYWLAHCFPVNDGDSDTDFTYYNDLIDMFWAWKWQEWKRKGEMCVTIMLPPTAGLIRYRYQKEKKSLTEYLKTAGVR